MISRRFPVLLAWHERRDYPDCPRTVAWDLLAPHEGQARRNHYQGLETLAARGGLDPLEMLAVLEGRRYGHDGDRDGAMRRAVDRLIQVNATFERTAMQDQQLDQLAHEIARAMHAAPRPQAQTGGGAAPAALPAPDALAAQIRPRLTPEFVAAVEDYGDPAAAAALFGGGGAGGGGQRKPFNLANFLKNLNAILAVVGPLIGVFTGVPIPPITLPVPGGPAPGQPGVTPAG